MKMIHRAAALVMVLLMLFTLTACNKKKEAVTAPEETAAAEATPTPTPEPTPEPTPRLTAGPGLITGDGVYFRNGPDTGERVIAIYNTGKPITIISVLGDWVVAEVDGYTGYLNAAYVSMDEAVSTSGSGESGVIKLDGVNFRSGPSMDAEILHTYPAGTPLTILGENGDWLTVVIAGQRGYVFAQYVDRAGPVPEDSPAPTATPTPTPTPAQTTGTGGTGTAGGNTGTGGGAPKPTPTPAPTPTTDGSGEVIVDGGSGSGNSGGNEGGSSGGDVTIEGEILVNP